MRPRQLRGLLFDFDDTLIDWSGVQLGWREIEAPRLARVLELMQGEGSASPVPLQQLVAHYTQRTREAWMEARSSLIAPRMPEILLDTLDELGFADARQSRDQILAAYDWSVVPGTVVFADVPPMLEGLQAAGIKLGIVTNSSQPMALRDAELRGHGLMQYFPDCRLAAADVGYLKPHRRIFEAALERLGTDADETVFIGDSPSADIAGALGIGMRAIQRITHRRRFQADGNPDFASLHSLAELPPILDAWYGDWRHG